MNRSRVSVVLMIAVITYSSCSRRSDSKNRTPDSATSAGTSTPAKGSAEQQTTAPPSIASAPPQETATPVPTQSAPPPVEPPTPKKYVLAAGTPISVRTLSNMSTKSAQGGSEFDARLENALVVEGHTLAKRGARVVGNVISADPGGRVKGKASLTLALSRLYLANGQTTALSTSSVTQMAQSGTKKNVTRTAVATGAGAAIGAIAGGGKGAAIGAGVGAGAGVATNLATRGPAAEIPPETVLNFSLTKDLVVIERP
jgi:hypothetical protein